MFKSYGPIRATPKDISQTLFSQSNVCMNKRKMTGECRLGSRAIIHPRRVRCRHERRDASRHPLMRSLLRVFSGIFFFFTRFLAESLDYSGRPRASGIDISEVTRLPAAPVRKIAAPISRRGLIFDDEIRHCRPQISPFQLSDK